MASPYEPEPGQILALQIPGQDEVRSFYVRDSHAGTLHGTVIGPGDVFHTSLAPMSSGQGYFGYPMGQVEIVGVLEGNVTPTAIDDYIQRLREEEAELEFLSAAGRTVYSIVTGDFFGAAAGGVKVLESGANALSGLESLLDDLLP